MQTEIEAGKLIYQLVVEAKAEARRDQRLYVRFPFFRPVTIHRHGRQFSGFSRDLGEVGIGLVHSFELPCGEVEISIGDPGQKVRVRTRIVWCEAIGDGWFTSGGEFVDLPDTPATIRSDLL